MNYLDTKQPSIKSEVDKKSEENFVIGNRVYILGAFDKSIASKVIPELIELIDVLKSEKNPFIEIYINSHGGFADQLFSLLTILDIAKQKGIKIITFNIGVAYSCGSLLAVIGDYRLMHKYATNLPHLGQACMTSATVEQLERNTKRIAKHFAKIYSVYATHTKVGKRQLDKILQDDDYFMDANDCLKYGFCDEII